MFVAMHGFSHYVYSFTSKLRPKLDQLADRFRDAGKLLSISPLFANISFRKRDAISFSHQMEYNDS